MEPHSTLHKQTLRIEKTLNKFKCHPLRNGTTLLAQMEATYRRLRKIPAVDFAKTSIGDIRISRIYAGMDRQFTTGGFS
jgi:hypothetical protein